MCVILCVGFWSREAGAAGGGVATKSLGHAALPGSTGSPARLGWMLKAWPFQQPMCATEICRRVPLREKLRFTEQLF